MMNVTTLIVLACVGFQDQRAEFHYDFRGGELDRRLLQIIGTDASKFAKPEADGLRVRIAFDGEDRRVTVATRFRVRGDFEITPTFDVRTATKPASDTGLSGISLEFVTDTPTNESARLQWHVAKNNSYFVTGRTTTVDGKRQNRGKRELTKASSVTVRLVRRGSTLHYFVAESEGGAFREIRQEEIGTEDLRAVRLVAVSSGPKSSLDLSWKDLTIRADALPGLEPILWTVDEERIIARPTALENGTIRLASRPPRNLALDELTRLIFNNPPTLEAHWFGQDNSDVVGAVPNATKNGIQDVHLSLTGLRAAKSIKQLVVVEQENRTTWKLDQNSRLLATFKSDDIAVGQQWQRVSHARAAPVETAMIRVRLISSRKTGKNNDGYFDSLSLSAVGKGQNLLKNPGNEAPLASGAIPNWTNVLGDWTKRSNSPTPHKGKAYFFAGVGERGELRQDVDVSAFAKLIATGKQRFVFEGYVRTWPNDPVDTSQIIIEFHQAENSSSSKLGLTREHGSDGAELYFEPAGDHFGHTFTVAVTYTDDTTALATTKATMHTDSKLKVDENNSKTGPSLRRNLPAITVAMEADDVLRGGLLSLNEEALTLATPWQSELEIPLVQILGLQFSSTDSEEDRGEFQKHLQAPGSTDTVVVRTADGGLTALKGSAQDFVDGKLRFTYKGEVRSINQSRLVGLVFAAHPPVRKWTAPYQVFRFFSGDKISGSWSAIMGESFQLETAWGSRLTLPARIVSDVSFRNGRLVYLSDLEPSSVREVPYFGRLMSYRRDKNLLSRPLKLGGKVYAKGLAVHSRCVLSYSLDGRFNRFKTLVGFDDTAEAKGHVLCRVLGDAKVLYAAALSSGVPVPLDLSVAGVEQLTLEIDFGDKEDTGDRVIWANARVLRN